MPQSNELRVFISSTFRDLQEEREHLIKKIFPEIRALCRERGITFTEVDLRWGLTEEDVVLGQVIRTCLEEIDKCRPYFIGITGERYGYVPQLHEYYKDPELLQRWPWIEEAAMDGSSIIDLEFRHAVLNTPPPAPPLARGGAGGGAGVARFFFRRQRRSLEDGNADNEERRRLDELKQRIRTAGLSVEEFRDPASLGEMIYDELIEIIQRDFADAKPPTPLEEERSKHVAFAASRRRAYIPNPEYLKRLNEWFSSSGILPENKNDRQDADPTAPLVIYAESGSGKSSLVAFWCEQLRRRQPELFTIEHYVGIGSGDSDHLGIIRHIIEEIRERFNRQEEIPSKPEDLERDFANWLGFTDLRLPILDFGLENPSIENPKSKIENPRMLLVIDGINQLSGRALDLHWLPPMMPQGVRLIISSTVEQTLVDLRRRGWRELGMQPLKEQEREAVVVRFLAEYHKALSAEQLRRIAEDVKCSHPLFLRTLLEELRLHGTHERLESALTGLLESTGTEDLFQRVLERLEDDYSQKVVREVMSLIWASRSGLSEEELSELTGIGRLKLSTLLLGLDYHLVRRDGLLSFFHDYLRRAVEKRYLGSGALKQQMHRRLGEYLERDSQSRRSASERMWSYEQSGDDAQLAALLGDLAVLGLLYKDAGVNEVLAQWTRLRQAGHDPTAIYLQSVEASGREPSTEQQTALWGNAALVLERLSEWSGAMQLHERILSVARAAGMQREAAEAERLLGRLLSARGAYSEAMERLGSALAAFEELGDRRGIAYAIGNIGDVYTSRGEYDRALECCERKLQICEELGDRNGIASAIGNMGNVYSNRGEYDRTLECYEQQLQISEELGDRSGIAMANNNMGLVYADRGENDRALECYERVLQIGEELGDRVGIAGVIHNIGIVYAARGRLSEAMHQYERALEINQSIGNRSWMAINLSQMGQVYYYGAEYDRAFECYERQAQICGELGEPSGIARASEGMGLVHLRRGEYDRALECFEQQLRICEELGDRRLMAAAIGFKGHVHRIRGEYDQALGAFEIASSEHRAIGNRSMLSYWLIGTSEILVELVEGCEVMPEYLAKYIPGAERGTPDRRGDWRAISLRVAREQAEESVAMLIGLFLFNARILLARIEAAEGRGDVAVQRLTGMLEEVSEPTSALDDSGHPSQEGIEQHAELHYWLWKLNATDGDHRAEALGLYQSLVEKIPGHEYRTRIDELTASTTPEATDGAGE